MADLLKFELVSPEKLLMSADVAAVTVPGVEGDFGVMVNHAPVLSSLRPGVLGVKDEAGKEERIFVRGGFAEVSLTGLTILATEATPMSDFTSEQLAQEIKNAEEDVADATNDDKRRVAQEALDQLKMLQQSM